MSFLNPPPLGNIQAVSNPALGKSFINSSPYFSTHDAYADDILRCPARPYRTLVASHITVNWIPATTMALESVTVANPNLNVVVCFLFEEKRIFCSAADT